MSKPKFKIGDRIILVAPGMFYDEVGTGGTIRGCIGSRNQLYLIKWDNDDMNKRDAELDLFDVFETEIEFEEVYNSPLCKLMKED